MKRKPEDKKEEGQQQQEEGKEQQAETPPPSHKRRRSSDSTPTTTAIFEHLPLELIELIFIYVGLKQCLLSADLVSKAWHDLVHSCDRMWSLFYIHHIVELTDPSPYPIDNNDNDNNNNHDTTTTTTTTNRIKCLEIVRECRRSYLPLDWALYRGYLGLARRVLIEATIPPFTHREQLDRYNHNCMKGTSGSTAEENINCVRCLVALGAPLDGDTPEWVDGNWLHFSCLALQPTFLSFLLTEFCRPINRRGGRREEGGGKDGDAETIRLDEGGGDATTTTTKFRLDGDRNYPTDRQPITEETGEADGGGDAEKIRLDVNKKAPGDGLTPLHCLFVSANSEDDEDLVERMMLMLLEYGADPSIEDNHGRTAFSSTSAPPRCVTLLKQMYNN